MNDCRLAWQNSLWVYYWNYHRISFTRKKLPQAHNQMLTTLDENSVVHLIKSCRFKQTCINWVIAWFSLYYRLWGCIAHTQSPPLPSLTTKGSNISHKHEWRADFTSSQKKYQKCKRGKGFLFIFTVTGQAPVSISTHFRCDLWVQCRTDGYHHVCP